MLRFVPKTVDGIPLEVDALTPNQLAGKTLDEISRLPVYDGNRERAIGDVFQVSGDATDGCIEIDGDCSRIKGLGKGMSSGSLIIRGNAGMHCGAEMTGGRLEVHGNASDWLGAEMRGGLIHVHGNVGNSTGGAIEAPPKECAAAQSSSKETPAMNSARTCAEALLRFVANAVKWPAMPWSPEASLRSEALASDPAPG